MSKQDDASSDAAKKPIWVKLQVAPEAYRFAESQVGKGGYVGAVDYLNALLNTALLRVMDEPYRPDPLENEPDSDDDPPL